ncbi:histidine phosphatase family (branch protein 1) (macronuclear) [Tetrahymena thermophila SB210]|uniref:Histidine phosphatase family (Branch protein 1) n=1 Tax=Tetrahymena thermophila (strain SB210) TaxID=312017 RepID=I7MKM6_TETTS|nr:histidine phosphatase family (branch protein 1) [Tetrahymena thermophila SB210]EAR99569.3 histidine phosphatase family (branch protein 1) [Tetrahymena thermophila SB210]|eukprot:XP_001019814.3 histidine phosphatase family (branch protein 1) [Tetrahymena thermophila SB210]
MNQINEEELELAQIYKCSFNQPPQNEEKYGKKLLLIRHALSEFNFKYERIFIENPQLQRTDPTLIDLRVSLEYIDGPLHQIGEKQCISHQDQVAKIETELVLISPLQRTLQTAILLFQKHPNRQNIKFLVYPWLSESLNCANCISNQIYGAMREKYLKEASKHNIQLDFSILDDKKIFPTQLQWQIESMENNENYKELAKNVTSEQQYAEHLSEQMRKMYPDFYETWDLMLKRSENLKNKLKEILKEQQKTVTVVSHCNILKCLTKVRVDEKGWVHGIHINNCGMTYYNFD